MANTNTQNKADLRDNLTHLDEKTREMYLRTCSENASHYDPSVFVEALVDEAGTMHLFVPAKNGWPGLKRIIRTASLHRTRRSMLAGV